MKRLFIALVFCALPSSAQVVTSTSRGVVIAHDGRVQLSGGWTADGVENATAIVAGSDRVAVLDALNNEAVIADLATGKTTRVQTAETPIAGVFLGRDLYVLARDARVVQRVVQGVVHASGVPLKDAPEARTTPVSIPLDPDPAFLREANGKLYVYSRTAGTLQEIVNDRLVRRVRVAPFASDFEIGGRTGYLVYPREARIRTIDLPSMKVTGAVAVGAVPVDLAFAGGGTALTARILAVADPSAKRIWFTEGTQSTIEAVARGFVRGFLGLGLFGSRSSQFPTGVDRIVVRDKIWVAYDSSSGTLYRFTKSKSSVIAKGIAPHAFAVTASGGVVYWKDGTLVAPGRER